jgi:hypothetical protein
MMIFRIWGTLILMQESQTSLGKLLHYPMNQSDLQPDILVNLPKLPKI